MGAPTAIEKFNYDALGGSELESASKAAHAAESAGFSRYLVTEASHDPFVLATIAGQATSSIEVGTGIAVAFARSPMTVAYSAWDLQRLTGGRFVLGLGSQVRPHIVRRFSMPWSSPAARMREFIMALRNIWVTWSTGAPLRFEGEFYRHDLMSPQFNPGPIPHSPPPVILAGVGAGMTEVAGELCDGFMCHPFTTARYLQEVTLPALKVGTERGGRRLTDLEVVGQPLVAPNGDDDKLREVRRRIAFYGSTPAYRSVLELHGWGNLHERWRALTQAGRWEEMPESVPDEVLEEFTVVASIGSLQGALEERYAGILQRVSLALPAAFTPTT